MQPAHPFRTTNLMQSVVSAEVKISKKLLFSLLP